MGGGKFVGSCNCLIYGDVFGGKCGGLLECVLGYVV